MTKRKDGQETRQRLLKAACEVFAQKGYRKAKVADICNCADANVAAVNYYFKGKTGLYVETCRYLFQQFEKSVIGALEDGSAQDRLRQYIRILLKKSYSQGRMGLFQPAVYDGIGQSYWIDRGCLACFDRHQEKKTARYHWRDSRPRGRITRACCFAN